MSFMIPKYASVLSFQQKITHMREVLLLMLFLLSSSLLFQLDVLSSVVIKKCSPIGSTEKLIVILHSMSLVILTRNSFMFSWQSRSQMCFYTSRSLIYYTTETLIISLKNLILFQLRILRIQLAKSFLYSNWTYGYTLTHCLYYPLHPA